MPITDDSKHDLNARLAKAIDHLNGVYRMVDQQKYCVDVLNQIKAVQASLDRVSESMLREHLETCVVEGIQNQDSKRIIEELMQIFKHAPELYAPKSATLTASAKLLPITAEKKCC